MRTLAAVLVVVLLLGSSVLVADSPYDSNVESEENPFAPERPATLDRTTATAYLVDYERTRLYNDLLSSRGHTVDGGDDVRTNCTAVSRERVTEDRFRVRLRCRGEIADVYRLVQPTGFTYTVTYRLTANTQEQLAIRGYPYAERDDLRPRPRPAK
ncbi:hypothetical protein ACFQJD_06985 [Haloplanus sp. GCM10025708]|uniref:hypothetical protein n=1 Tax=Haloferacaceae TaxID=1644056 RepID=UPI003623B15E